MPSAQLRAWGASAIDEGGIVTRIEPRAIWVRPLKSTRAANGFGWIWSRHKEYVVFPGDCEVVA